MPPLQYIRDMTIQKGFIIIELSSSNDFGAFGIAIIAILCY